MALNLCTLPPEVVEEIFAHLKGDDICRVGSCSRQLRLRALKEHVWKDCARRDYSVELDCIGQDPKKLYSAKKFYMLVLRKYGSLLGRYLQRSNFQYYGGLATMVYQDWSLYLVLLNPPPFPHTEQALQPEYLCKISLDLEGNLDIQSCIPSMPVPVELTLCGSDIELNYKVSSHMPDMEEEFSQFRKTFGLDDDRMMWGRQLIVRRFENYVGYKSEGCQNFCLLQTPSSEYGFEPITPGIYKGTYSAHGIELINVYYDDDTHSIIGRKITGDPNVPCKEITFQASLTGPVVLPNDIRLRDIARYIKENHVSLDFADVCNTNVSATLFEQPAGCHFDVDLDEDVFKTKMWQFKCSCQVSPDNFADPKMIDGLLIVFSKNVFGVIFLELSCLSIYRRAEMDFNDTSLFV